MYNNIYKDFVKLDFSDFMRPQSHNFANDKFNDFLDYIYYVFGQSTQKGVFMNSLDNVKSNALKAIEENFSLALKKQDAIYLDGTFSQIVFCWAIGLFEDQEKETLLNRLDEIEDSILFR